LRVARRIGLVAAPASVITLVLVAAVAWACVPGSGPDKKLTVTPVQVRPGDPVTVSAPASAGTSPIEVRLGGRAGPLLGTLSAPQDGSAGGPRATFTVPLTTEPGRHALTAGQAGATWDPVVLAVAGPDGAVPESSAAAPADADGNRARGRLPTVLALAGAGLAAVAWSARGRRRRVDPPATVAREV